MRWYFDLDGKADGPHDEAAMAAARKDGRIQPQTLIWTPDMDGWQAAAELDPPWWELDVVTSQPAWVRLESAEERRRPVPKAPIGGAHSRSGRGSFVRRLFKAGSKKA